MPLDAGDLEKITTIIDKSISRLERDMASMMPRNEYEKRHDELYGRTVKTEQNIEKLMQWALSEHEKINMKIDTRVALLEQIGKEANKQIDEVKQLINMRELEEQRRRNSEKITTLRYIVTIIVSIVLGILLPIVLKLFGV